MEGFGIFCLVCLAAFGLICMGSYFSSIQLDPSVWKCTKVTEEPGWCVEYTRTDVRGMMLTKESH